MPNVKIESTNTNLTLGLLLRTLHSVTKNYFHSQPELFAALFKSYCEYRGGPEYPDWIPCQSSINKLFRDKGPLSWYQSRFYFIRDYSPLRQDVDRFIKLAVPTAKQYSVVYSRILSLVQQSSNLDPKDKDAILSPIPDAESSELSELLFQALRVLMQYKSFEREVS